METVSERGPEPEALSEERLAGLLCVLEEAETRGEEALSVWCRDLRALLQAAREREASRSTSIACRVETEAAEERLAALNDRLEHHAPIVGAAARLACMLVEDDGKSTYERILAAMDVVPQLRAQLASSQANVRALAMALRGYVEEFGGIHEDETCPEDSTCTCPMVKSTNDALARPGVREALETPDA